MNRSELTTDRQFWFWLQLGKVVYAIIHSNMVRFKLMPNDQLMYWVGQEVFLTSKEDMSTYSSKMFDGKHGKFECWVECSE